MNNLVRGRRYRYRYEVDFESGRDCVRFSMLIKTTSGAELGGAMSAISLLEAIPDISAGSTASVGFEFTCSLTAGVYFLNAGVTGMVDDTETFLHRALDLAAFRVMADSRCLATSVVDFSCTPSVSLSQGH